VRPERSGRRWLALVAVVLGLLVVQLAGFAHMPLFGVRPELLLVFVLGVALQRGASEGLVVGMLTGFLADLVGGYLVGLSAVSYGASGWAAGFIGDRVYPDRGLVVLAIVAGGTILSQLVYVAGASAFGLPWPPVDGLVEGDVGSDRVPPALGARCVSHRPLGRRGARGPQRRRRP